ncbi:MAG: hypothetical protein HYV62_07015 [Candidatus Rokubacteria bacterium]|nr:hypothetical protein [Candidatus Rokubacteria bacterium]
MRKLPPGAPLLVPVMASGALVARAPALDEIRARCAAELAALPDEVRRLRSPGSYAVRPSERLVARQRALRATIEATEVRPALEPTAAGAVAPQPGAARPQPRPQREP